MTRINQLERALSVENFIALWLAIHGGDPAPDAVGVLVAGSAVIEQLQHVDADKSGELRAQTVEAMQKALSGMR